MHVLQQASAGLCAGPARRRRDWPEASQQLDEFDVGVIRFVGGFAPFPLFGTSKSCSFFRGHHQIEALARNSSDTCPFWVVFKGSQAGDRSHGRLVVSLNFSLGLRRRTLINRAPPKGYQGPATTSQLM